jgi:hypothetical protein
LTGIVRAPNVGSGVGSARIEVTSFVTSIR